MIRLATMSDVPAIAASLPQIIQIMNAAGNDQWSARYPQAADFARDIEMGTLFVEVDTTLRGYLCLSQEEPPEYADVAWAVPSPALVLHRMALLPTARGKGLGHALFRFVDEEAARQGLALRSDTYTVNPVMNALFLSHGWSFRGNVRFSGRAHAFNCYDKPCSIISR